MFRSRELLDLAYLLECQAQIPGICTGGMGEPMHSNQSAHGQGTSIKAHDCYFGAGCRACHQAIDHGHPSLSAEDRRHYWRLAADRTLLRLFQLGYIAVARMVREDVSAPPAERAKKSKGRTASPSKIVPREQPSWRKAG